MATNDVTSKLSLELPKQRLYNKNVIITGGANGIGASIAETFYKHGANIAIIDIASFTDICDKINTIERQLLSLQQQMHDNKTELIHKPTVLYMECDISDETQVSKTLLDIQKQFIESGNSSANIKYNTINDGKIDILINNAAKFVLKNAMNATLNDWNNSINVNLIGTINMIKYTVPLMRKTIDTLESSIVIVSSVSGFVAQPNMVTYSMTKAGLLGINRNNALDLYKDYGIRVNCVCPGTIFTNASVNEMKQQGWTKEQWDKIKMENAIIKRPGKVEEVAMAVLFYASKDSTFCTGSVLNVDGGWSAL